MRTCTETGLLALKTSGRVQVMLLSESGSRCSQEVVDRGSLIKVFFKLLFNGRLLFSNFMLEVFSPFLCSFGQKSSLILISTELLRELA